MGETSGSGVNITLLTIVRKLSERQSDWNQFCRSISLITRWEHEGYEHIRYVWKKNISLNITIYFILKQIYLIINRFRWNNRHLEQINNQSHDMLGNMSINSLVENNKRDCMEDPRPQQFPGVFVGLTTWRWGPERGPRGRPTIP